MLQLLRMSHLLSEATAACTSLLSVY